jgi:sec-independent protein translocase protein TatB
MFGIGLPEMVIIVVVALIFIGPQQLPEVMRTLGRGLVQLKRATNDIRSTVQDEMNQIEKELDTKELRELKDVKDEVQNTIGNVTSTFNPLQGRQADGEKLVDLANAMEGKPAESPSTSSSGEKQEAASTETSESAPEEAPSPAAAAMAARVRQTVAEREAEQAQTQASEAGEPALGQGLSESVSPSVASTTPSKQSQNETSAPSTPA